MPMANYPKRIKKLLRELMTQAYERELHRELTKLEQSFAEWRDGKISSGELSNRVHQYETGPSRELFKRYNDSALDMMVAYAVVAGIFDENEVPGEVSEAISGHLSFFRSLKEQGKLQMPK
ncbi:MAG: hypothetical protein A2162_10515 [Deltaproteobacteria bacterium RBG_13_52_11b]|nr:MAG: hypothetical protein A2162_10515 [Deltaproteobacteria bacterium RBG_13_52_11b]